MANGGIIGTVNNPTSTTATGVWQQEEQYEARVTDTWPERSLFTTKSLRFNDGSSDYLSRTKGTSTSTTKGTYSFWFKLSKTTGLTLIENGTAAADRAIVYIQSDSTLKLFSKIGNSTKLDLGTNRVFRDLSSWYNVVIAIDTTQGTASNRVKLYVNGTQETSFASSTYPDQNDALRFFTSSEIEEIGIDFENGGLFDGYMAEVIKIDGQQLAPTSFGVTNSDGVWTPIIYLGTYGNNGFNLQFENAAALGTDSSPNGNTFTVNNLTSIDQSTDYPEVNYATMSTPTWYNGTIANGGLTISTNATNYRYQPSSIGVSSGKWYWEIKFTTASNYALMGITDQPHYTTGSTNILGSGAYDYALYYGDGNASGGDGHLYNNAGASPGNTPGAFMGAFSQGDIIMFALDCDNNTLKIGANNSWSNGSGSTNQTFSNTTAKAITAVGSTSTGFYFPAVGDYGGGTSVFDLNFGSPPFAISSGNADGNGYGNFEYAVPSGYYALNTANLAEFG